MAATSITSFFVKIFRFARSIFFSISLSSDVDYVVGMLLVKREGTILVATEKGYGKRTEVLQYRTQTRAGKGVLTMRCTDKTGKMVNIMEVVDSDDLIVITDSGVLMRQPVKDIRAIGINTHHQSPLSFSYKKTLKEGCEYANHQHLRLSL